MGFVLSELFLMRPGYAQHRGDRLLRKPREGISQGDALDWSLDLFDGIDDGRMHRLQHFAFLTHCGTF